MTNLPTVHKPGLRVWRAILLELLRREREREAPPSVAALARAAGKSRTQTREYLAAMRDAKVVTTEIHYGQSGSDVRLTPMGRLIARLLEVPLDLP